MNVMWNKIRENISLERLANVAILLTAFVAFGLLCFNFAAKNARPTIRSGLMSGQSFPRLATKSYENYPYTLLLVLNTDCGHCRASFPFYKRLLETARNNRQPIQIIGVFPNGSVEVKELLTESGLQMEVLASVNLSDLNIGGTPSLVLLNQKGEVTDFSLGKLSPQQELQVLTSIVEP